MANGDLGSWSFILEASRSLSVVEIEIEKASESILLQLSKLLGLRLRPGLLMLSGHTRLLGLPWKNSAHSSLGLLLLCSEMCKRQLVPIMWPNSHSRTSGDFLGYLQAPPAQLAEAPCFVAFTRFLKSFYTTVCKTSVAYLSLLDSYGVTCSFRFRVCLDPPN